MLRPRRSTALTTMLVLFLLAAASTVLRAQTTGSLVGEVHDESGAPLPGVTVEARSPSLQGSQPTTTNTSGLYRLTLLPPGQYTLTFTMPGFSPEKREALTVGLDKVTTVDVTMRKTMVETVEVLAAPLVDTTSADLGYNLTSEHIESLPTGRNYSSVVQVVPGTSTDASNNNLDQSTITVYGSSGAENSYYIDGVNTTNLEYGFQGKELNYEFIQEIDVKTGGYEAEYGKSTGGIVNVITKSGGNELHGDVFVYFDDDSLQSNSDPIVSTGGTVEGFRRADYGFDLGGFFVKDKLWYFVAYDRVDNTTDTVLDALDSTGAPITIRSQTQSDRDLAAAKLTFRLSPKHSLIGSFFQDPRTDTGAINDANHSLNGEELTYLGRQEFGGRDYALRYEGVLGQRWAIAAQLARHDEENSVGPESSAGDAVQFREVDNNFFQTGGFGLIQTKDFSRDMISASATRFLGKSQIKFGVEYEQQKADVVKRMSGGQLVDVFEDPGFSGPIYVHSYWTTATATVDDAPISALNASPEHHNTTFYVQGSWAALSNLTINAGVRWDRQEIIDASGKRQIDLDRDFAPRLGFIWDPRDDHGSKVYGSYGRFYEQIPMDLVIRSFSFERQPRIVNFDPLSTTPDPAAEAELGTTSAILGGFTEPSDPDLRNQYIHEFILGYEREVRSDVAVGIKGIYRYYGEVVEDFLCMDDGTYCIGNPGKGIMKEIFTLDYSQTFAAPKPKREYKGVQLDVTKRFSHNWQGIASYIYSKLDGNYDGEFAPFTNVGADPNISAAYDYYDFFTDGANLSRITNDGSLSNDRRHQFKVSGVYYTPFKLSVGWSAYYRSGTPLTRFGYSDAYGRYEFFLTERGAEGRAPDNYEADLHLGYPLALKKTTLNLMLDVFNLLDAQQPVLLDQRWGFQESDNAQPTPANPDYLKPALRTPPRTFRAGLRLSF